MSNPSTEDITARPRLMLRRVAIWALLGSVLLPPIGLTVTYLDSRYSDPCRPAPSGAVIQAFPVPVWALSLCWAGVVCCLLCLVGGGWWVRTATGIFGRTHGRWVLILSATAVLLVFNGLLLWNVYGTWVDTAPNCV